MTVMPGQKGTAGVEQIPDPDMRDGALLVRGMAVGICGTDREIAEGAYGTPPSGEARLITRRVPLTSWTGKLERQHEDIKVVVDLTA